MKSCGILVLSNIKNIKSSLKAVETYVNRLYIHINVSNDNKTKVPCWSSVISEIYKNSLIINSNMDVRVLIHPLKQYKCEKVKNVKMLFSDGKFPEICETLRKFYSIDELPIILNDESVINFDNLKVNTDDKLYNTVVMGGTFDRIHTGHKIFLTEAALRACKKLVVGVTDENMLKSKTLSELILPTEQRIKDVKAFLTEIDCSLQYEVVPIQDPFGPTKCDPDMDMIVVSTETFRGGEKVNEIRKQNNLKELEIHCINMVEANLDVNNEHKEVKVSSSNGRMDLLGTLLQAPDVRSNLSKRPYVIGLTGSIASGKSKMAERFQKLGAYIIDCDKIAHETYEPGQISYQKIIQHFGQDIIDVNKKIDRKKLGGIVFGNPKELEALNEIVWPGIIQEVKKRISQLNEHKVVILEAAVLLKAKWETECHEVWSMIIPPEVAIKRIQERNALSEDEARKRIASQLDNKYVVKKSNVVFSSEWSYEFTQHQAERAWNNLLDRLDSESSSHKL